jgi:hypothetical protein
MLQQITQHTLTQLSSILKQIHPVRYSSPLTTLNGKTIGQHVRHILEFYTCLLHSSKQGFVNYDLRERDLNLENNVDFALLSIENIIETFCSKESHDTHLINVMEFNKHLVETHSSLHRELAYLIEHSVHHFAIIEIAIRTEFKELKIPQNFGVAYSTVKHQEEIAHLEYH